MYVIGCVIAYPIMTSKWMVDTIEKELDTKFLEPLFIARCTVITSWVVPLICAVGCIMWLYDTVVWELEYRMFRKRVKKQEVVMDMMERMESKIDELQEEEDGNKEYALVVNYEFKVTKKYTDESTNN